MVVGSRVSSRWLSIILLNQLYDDAIVRVGSPWKTIEDKRNSSLTSNCQWKRQWKAKAPPLRASRYEECEGGRQREWVRYVKSESRGGFGSARGQGADWSAVSLHSARVDSEHIISLHDHKSCTWTNGRYM